MIVSHKYKCIIVQPRKTAGTSLTELFKKIDPEFEKDYEKWNKPIPPYNHQPASQCREIVGEDIWDSYYKVGFIREPFDWIRSYYMHERKSRWPANHPVTKQVALTLRWNEQLPLEGNIITADNFLSLFTFMKWWYPPAGAVGQVSWFDEELDHIGIFENISEEVEHLGNLLGFDGTLLPHVNKSPSRQVRLSTKAYQIISILLEDDIEFYNRNKLLDLSKR